MKKRKNVSLLTMLFFALTIIAPVAYAADVNDISGHWAEAQISDMADRGIISGYPDGSFKPEGQISRAEFATLTVKAFNLSVGGGKTFSDTADHWAKDFIATANACGVVNGYSDTQFAPDDPITREQMAVMISKAAQLPGNVTGKTFSDSQNISAWAVEAVAIASGNNVISGYPDGTFKPKNNTNRAEATVVLKKAMEVPAASTSYSSIDRAGTYGPKTGTETVNYNVTIKAKGVTLQNLIIKGDLIIAEEVGDGDVTLNNIKVEGKTYVRGGGKDSIHINGGEYSQIIIEKTATGAVRIVATNAKGVQIIISEDAGGEEVILQGNFDGVTINADNVKVIVGENSHIDKLTVKNGSEGVEVDLGGGSNVDEMVLDSKTKISGTGTVDKASGSQAKESTYETQPGSVTTTTTGGGSGGGGGTPATVAVTGVSLNPTILSLTEGGETGTLTATVAPSNASNKNVTWSSSNTSVATVANGVVTPVAAGTATITVTTADGGHTDTCAVTVTVATPTPTYTVTYDGNDNDGGTVPVDPNSPYAEGAEVTVLGNTGSLSRAGYTFDKWNTASDGSGTDYAADGTGTFFMGTANVTLYAQWTTTIIPVDSISVEPTEVWLAVYESVYATVTATVLPEDATNKTVTWSSDDESIARVDYTVLTGMIKGITAGHTTITVTTEDGNRTASVTAYVYANVTAADAGAVAAAMRKVPPTMVVVRSPIPENDSGKCEVIKEILEEEPIIKSFTGDQSNGTITVEKDVGDNKYKVTLKRGTQQQVKTITVGFHET